MICIKHTLQIILITKADNFVQLSLFEVSTGIFIYIIHKMEFIGHMQYEMPESYQSSPSFEKGS